MCGIAGVFGRQDEITVSAMLDALRHRGPDDGHVIGGRLFTLGARRLSIVDVDGGRQPLAGEDGTVWAAQNGELYNFPEERPRLEDRGHRFRTMCDTELLPHLYEEVGVDLPTHLDGMFAISLWDSRRQLGLLARDRVGKKPLYYYQASEVLYFASEIKALLRIPGFQRRINREALHHYLALKHVPQPLCIFEGIRALPPAHRLVWRPAQSPTIDCYWRADFSPSRDLADLDEDELVEQLLNRLRRSVQRRQMGDVPVGYFLSGGIDSSLIAALAAEQASTPIKTFTLTYDIDSTAPGKDEDRRWARWLADRWRTEHHEETIGFADFPDHLRRALACFDEPFAGVITTYVLAQRMSRHVKVAISGDGADELFGSYLTHRLAFPLANYAAFRRSGDAALIRPFEKQTDRLAALAAAEDWAWRSKIAVFTEAERAALYAPELAPAMRSYNTSHYWQRTFAGLTAQDPLNRILEAEFRTIFPDQVLAFVDRLSMTHALEVRSAFLDQALVGFVAALPGRLKIKDGETKYLLKRAALRYLPDAMVRRPKEGFLMPVSQWLSAHMEPYVRDTLSPSRLAEHAFFDRRVVQRLVDRMYEAPCDYTHVNKVYCLLVFQEWYDLYFRGA